LAGGHAASLAVSTPAIFVHFSAVRHRRGISLAAGKQVAVTCVRPSIHCEHFAHGGHRVRFDFWLWRGFRLRGASLLREVLISELRPAVQGAACNGVGFPPTNVMPEGTGGRAAAPLYTFLGVVAAQP
jgi:hypothetical protein